MKAVPIISERLDWSSAIGLFLINFGTLEYFVNVFLKDHLPDDEFGRVKERPLKDRVNRIAKLLQDANHPAKEQAAFAGLLSRLAPVRDLRNHIAHGHMYLRLDAKTQKPTVTLLRAKDLDTGLMPEAKHVDYAELESALQTLVGLIEEFQSLAGFETDGCAVAEEDLKT